MIIGIDEGYGAIKMVSQRKGALITTELPSVVAQAGRALLHEAGLSRSKPPTHIQANGNQYWVGPTAHDWGRPVENLDLERFVGGPELRALLYAAWSQLGLGNGESLDVAVGLPIAVLSGEKGEVQNAVRGVRKFLAGEHTWYIDRSELDSGVTVESVRVASQAVGAYFDYLLQADGSWHPARKADFKQEIGILSIGFNTVDMLAVRAGKPLQRFTGADTAGVRRLLELHNHQGLYSLGELDMMLREGRLKDNHAMRDWSREVLGFIEKRWGESFKRFHRVVAVGGGSLLLKKQLRRKFGSIIHVPPAPVLATARGLYKFGVKKK